MKSQRWSVALKLAIVHDGRPQIEIASKAGIHESRLSKIVRGHVAPRPEERAAIAKALRLPESDLFSEAA